MQKLKAGAVPSIFHWIKEESASSKERKIRTKNRSRKHEENSVSDIDEHSHDPCILDDGVCEVSMVEISETDPIVKSQFVQTEDSRPTIPNVDVFTQADPPVVRMAASDYDKDSRAFQFFTGLDNYQIFMDAFTSLGPAVNELEYYNSYKPYIKPEDQFFFTLIKLRTYRTNFELSLMFKISETEVYSLFITWIRFMSLQWKEINLWPDRDIVHFYAPSDFKRKFPMTRAIFDGTECPIKKPSAPAAQQMTFSTYKNRNTNKVLIGITPGGQVSYVSSAYGGSTSDRQIIERSDIFSKVDPTDSIMSDKGFDVQDIFAPMDVTVNIPTFFKKKNRMDGKTVLRDRMVSSKRVHVERIIGLGKTYKILRNPLNQTETMLSSDILFVCYMLVNFRKCIVSRNA